MKTLTITMKSTDKIKFEVMTNPEVDKENGSESDYTYDEFMNLLQDEDGNYRNEKITLKKGDETITFNPIDIEFITEKECDDYDPDDTDDPLVYY